MELIHILPKKNLISKPRQKYELYLADEVLKDPRFYARYVCGTPGYKILDNSLNELGASLSLSKLNEAARIICPDEMVYPDSIDPEESDELFKKCKGEIYAYKYLKDLKKMAVVHANDWRGALEKSIEYVSLGADVLAYSKVTSEQWGHKEYDDQRYDGRVSIVSMLLKLGVNVDFHFLGFSGLEEFRGRENISVYVRSMDSRFFFEVDNLWKHREDILSHVPLGGDRSIPDIEKKIKAVREEYEGYGLC